MFENVCFPFEYFIIFFQTFKIYFYNKKLESRAFAGFEKLYCDTETLGQKLANPGRMVISEAAWTHETFQLMLIF